MEKLWVKFEKDWEDSDGTGFKKDDVVELEKSAAESLIMLKMVGKAVKPEGEGSLNLKELSKNISITIKETVDSAIASATADGFKDVNDNLQKHLNVKVIHELSPEAKFHKNIELKYGDYSTNKYWEEILANSQPGGQIFKGEEFTKVADPQGINTLDDREGGFLIPETVLSEIWTGMMKENENILGRTDQRFTSGNNLSSLRMTETSRAAGTRHGGVQAYWTDEAELFTKSQPAWDKLNMFLHKLTALVYVTEEELADASNAIVPTINKLAASAIGFLVNDSFYDGTGVGKPQGILKSDSLGIQARTATTGTVKHLDINPMYHKMVSWLRPGAEWIVHPNVAEQLPLVVFNDDATANIPIFFPSTSSGQDGLVRRPFGTMMGLPVRISEHCKDIDTQGDIILQNWSEYRTLQKLNGGIKSAVSMHTRFLYEEKAFRFSFRIGGQSLWSSGQTDFNGSTERFPTVVLAGLDSDSSGL